MSIPLLGDGVPTALKKLGLGLQSIETEVQSLRIPRDFRALATLGLIPGVSRFTVQGHNTDVDTGSVPEDVWQFGGLYPFPTSAQSLEVLSSSAADTAAGTGARSVRVTGTAADLSPISEVVVMNGTSPVALSNSFYRINLFVAVTAGSDGSNAGSITLRVASAGPVLGFMEARDGLSMSGIYTVPAGFRAVPIDVFLSLNRPGGASTTNVEVVIKTRDQAANSPWIARQIFSLQSNGTSVVSRDPATPRVLPAGTDFRFEVVNVSSNDANISASVGFILFADTFS